MDKKFYFSLDLFSLFEAGSTYSSTGLHIRGGGAGNVYNYQYISTLLLRFEKCIFNPSSKMVNAAGC